MNNDNSKKRRRAHRKRATPGAFQKSETGRVNAGDTAGGAGGGAGKAEEKGAFPC